MIGQFVKTYYIYCRPGLNKKFFFIFANRSQIKSQRNKENIYVLYYINVAILFYTSV